MLHIVRTIFLWRGTAYQRISVQNHSENPASFDLTLLFDNDFADLFDGARRAPPAPRHSLQQIARPLDVLLEYIGLDGKSRSTALPFDPRPTRLTAGVATYHPRAGATTTARAVCCLHSATSQPPPEPVPIFRACLAHRREMRQLTSGATSIETSNKYLQARCCASRWLTSTC